MRKNLIRYLISTHLLILLVGCSDGLPEAALATPEEEDDSVVEAQIAETFEETMDYYKQVRKEAGMPW